MGIPLSLLLQEYGEAHEDPTKLGNFVKVAPASQLIPLTANDVLGCLSHIRDGKVVIFAGWRISSGAAYWWAPAIVAEPTGKLVRVTYPNHVPLEKVKELFAVLQGSVTFYPMDSGKIKEVYNV